MAQVNKSLKSLNFNWQGWILHTGYNKLKLRGDLPQTKENIKSQILRFLQRNIWQAGSVCPPAMHFLVKIMNLTFLYFN